MTSISKEASHLKTLFTSPQVFTKQSSIDAGQVSMTCVIVMYGTKQSRALFCSSVVMTTPSTPSRASLPEMSDLRWLGVECYLQVLYFRRWHRKPPWLLVPYCAPFLNVLQMAACIKPAISAVQVIYYLSNSRPHICDAGGNWFPVRSASGRPGKCVFRPFASQDFVQDVTFCLCHLVGATCSVTWVMRYIVIIFLNQM